MPECDAQMMESSESLTPPGSPILGYSGLRTLPVNDVFRNDDEFILPSQDAKVAPVFSFSCKGPILPRSSDHSFCSKGMFSRKQAIAAIKILKKDFNYIDEDEVALSPTIESPTPDETPNSTNEYSLLGHKFNPFDPHDFTIIMKMVQKKVFTLMNLSRPNFPVSGKRKSNETVNINATTSDPFQIRADVCTVFNLLVTHRARLFNPRNLDGDFEDVTVMRDDKVRQYFNGLRKCLGTVTSLWSPSLRLHCGSKDGNTCSSPEFHLFHLHLELRWFLLIITGLNSSILNGMIQDLLELALLKYQQYSHTVLESIPPFNCYCVKELWSMIRLVADQVNLPGNRFWDIVITNLSVKCSTMESNLQYPLWVLSHLVSVYDYALNGMYSSTSLRIHDQMVGSSCCYKFVNQLVKRWIQRKGKIEDVCQFMRRFIPYWGFDLEVFNTLWSDLLPKLDKGAEVGSMRHYSSSVNWYKLISQRIAKKDTTTGSCGVGDRESLEPFVEFLSLLYMQVKLCSIKDYRKLKSSLCNRLTPKIVGSMNEIGLARVSTMYLVLAFAAEDSLALCQRLNETLEHSKDLFLPTKFRARCTMILLLLAKSVNISTICSDLMKSVEEFIITSSRNAAQKELVMIYIETLEYLSNCGSGVNLGQSHLIPSNLPAWLTTCGHNYVVRTLQSLHKLFENWIMKDSPHEVKSQHFSSMNNVCNNEKNLIGEVIEKATLPFIKQSVLMSHQQQFASDYDTKPFADLAADFTIVHGLLQHLYMNSEMVAKLFEYFAVNDKVCPNVSERYVGQVIKSKWGWSGIISDVLLTQAWIRLIFLGYDVPLQLSVHVLSLNSEISFPSITTNTELLLTQFCEVVNESTSVCWSRSQLQALLVPTLGTLKAIANISSATKANSGTSAMQEENKNRTESYIKSCCTLLKKVKFDKIYLRNSHQSLVHQVLDALCPPFVGKPPWEKLPQPVVASLRKYLPDIFTSLVSYVHWKQDPYLKRKLGDVVRFALLGYVGAEEMSETNPGLVIMQFCERQPNTAELLTEISSNFQAVAKEVHTTKRFMLAVIGFMRRNMISTVVALVHPVLEILMEREVEFTSNCIKILSHVFATVMTSLTPSCNVLKTSLMHTLDTVMSKHFAFRSKKFFDLFSNLTRGSSSYTNAKSLPVLKKFVKFDVIPLLEKYIHFSEAKQGSGTNFSLRSQLEELEKRLTESAPT